MNLAKRLYELQHVDLELQGYRDTIGRLNLQIDDNSVVVKAKADLDALKKHLAETNQKRRDLEWEVDELQKNISKLNDKLYGGKVGNPKELLSIEQEAETFKSRLSQKEDELLELMNDEEVTQKRVKAQSELVEKGEVEWQQGQKDLMQKRDDEEKQLLELDKKRQALTSNIDPQAFSLYEGLRARKGQAVVKIEQGRCQGCRISLSMTELQRARSGAVIQCGSCNKILYLE